jgi:hypothetical protein
MNKLKTTLAVALLAVGCGGQGPTTSNLDDVGAPGGQGFVPRAPVADYGTFLSHLAALQKRVQEAGPAQQPYLSVEGKVLLVGGERMEAYEYPAADRAEREASLVPPTGVPDGWQVFVPVIPPTGYRAGRLIVIATDPSTDLRTTMDGLMGKPFTDLLSEPGSGGRGRALDLLKVTRGASFSGGPERPAVLLVTSPDEAQALAGMLDDPDEAARVAAADLSGGPLVAVFRGAAVTPGYDIAIDAIETGSGDGTGPATITVRVSMASPPPDGIIAQVLTYPHDVVQVAGVDLSGDAVWTVVNGEGDRIAVSRDPRRLPDEGKPGIPGGEVPEEGPETVDVR